jgi:GNAT superfamily N-acetyltransferase
MYYGRKIDSGRLVIMGVKEEYRKAGIEAVLYEQAIKTAYQLGIRWVESSMILEQNSLTRRAAELSGGKAYKTYRIYQMPI